MNSRPASSEIFAASRLFSHEASHRSGAFVMVNPPEQLSPNSPSLKRLPPCMRWSRRLVIGGRSQLETIDDDDRKSVAMKERRFNVSRKPVGVPHDHHRDKQIARLRASHPAVAPGLG